MNNISSTNKLLIEIKKQNKTKQISKNKLNIKKNII